MNPVLAATLLLAIGLAAKSGVRLLGQRVLPGLRRGSFTEDTLFVFAFIFPVFAFVQEDIFVALFLESQALVLVLALRLNVLLPPLPLSEASQTKRVALLGALGGVTIVAMLLALLAEPAGLPLGTLGLRIEVGLMILLSFLLGRYIWLAPIDSNSSTSGRVHKL